MLFETACCALCRQICCIHCIMQLLPPYIATSPWQPAPISCSLRPERFLELPAMPHAYTFTAFNAGPRLCLGKTLAELEGVYFLVSAAFQDE